MTQHIFEYLSHTKTVYNREYLCKFGKCIPKFFMLPRRIKKVDLDEIDKEVAITGNAEAEIENHFCELDNDDNDAIQLYQSTDIPSYISVIMHDVLLP